VLQILYPSRRMMAILLFLLVVPHPGFAQFSATPAGGNQADSSAKQDFSQEPFVYEYIHASMRYENDGSGTREVRARLRVQTPAGLNSAGQLIFQYNALDEQVEIRSIRVLKPDGAIVTAGPETVQDLSAPVAREAPMYTDARQKHVTVPGLAVNDVIEYDVLINWHIWNFEQKAIALDEQLDLNVPANLPPKTETLFFGWERLTSHSICPSKLCRCCNELRSSSRSMPRPISRWARPTWKPGRTISQWRLSARCLSWTTARTC
jgi:Domain of Unknown Function with PDB structure (DUF3857)